MWRVCRIWKTKSAVLGLGQIVVKFGITLYTVLLIVGMLAVIDLFDIT